MVFGVFFKGFKSLLDGFVCLFKGFGWVFKGFRWSLRFWVVFRSYPPLPKNPKKKPVLVSLLISFILWNWRAGEPVASDPGHHCTGVVLWLKKKDTCILSETGREVFMSLTGRKWDESRSRISNGRIFQRSWNTSRAALSSSLKSWIRWFPHLFGWKKKNDEALKKRGLLFGALAASKVSSIDTLQNCVKGLKVYAIDFSPEENSEKRRLLTARRSPIFWSKSCLWTSWLGSRLHLLDFWTSQRVFFVILTFFFF